MRRLSNLMDDGLVIKQRDPNDARRIWVALTDKATRLIDTVMGQVAIAH